jgi:hypothetical protein
MTIDLQPYTLVKATEPVDKCFLRPFTIVDKTAAVWNVATNRNWLVAVRGKGQYSRWKGNAVSFNTMLGLIQAEPTDPYEVESDPLTQWLKDKEGLARVLGVVVSIDKLRLILNVGITEKMLLWNISKVTENQPCIALAEKGVRLVLMGHDESKIEKGTSIEPIESSLLVKASGPLKPGNEMEQGGFDLAMALGDNE